MFTKITLENFRSFDHLEFDLTRKGNDPKHLAIVYGENGAGKSNLMSAFVLLIELMKTLDVRDAYEELLARRAIFSDEMMEKAMRQQILSELRDMQAIIDDCRMVGSIEPIIAKFEFSIGGNAGEYYVELGENEIQHERLEFLLNKRRGVYFDCKAGSISINNGIAKDKDLLSDIKAAAKRFWGKHSILSIVLHELEDKSEAFGWENLSQNFLDVLAEFKLLSCSLGLGSRRWDSICVPIQVLKKADAGRMLKEQEEELDIAEKIFTQFFSTVNPDIRRVYYEKTYNDRFVDYRLFFEKLIAGTYRNIPFAKESMGNHQLLRTLSYILCACLGATVVIDEADSGIHDVLFKEIIMDIQESIQGQLIMSTHNTLLMETEFARDAVYIMKEDNEGYRSVRCINSYDKRTYINSNTRNKYLNNDYYGLPRGKSIEIGPSIDILLGAIKNGHQ